MKIKKSTLASVLLTAMICTSTSKNTYAQLPPRMVATTSATFYDGEFHPSDSMYFQYNSPSGYNPRLKTWLPSIMASISALDNHTIDSTIHSYDSDKNLIATIRLWEYNGWDTSDQAFYTYNSNHLITKKVTKSNTYLTPKWEVDETNYTYDVQNNLIEELTQKFDYTTGLNENLNRTTYTYSGSQIVSEIHSDWRNNQWEIEDRTRYHYNSGIIDTIWRDDYHTAISEFVNYQFDFNHINVQNDIDTVTTYVWIDPDWVVQKRHFKAYDASRNIVQSARQYISINDWQYEYSDSFYYNADNIPSLKIQYQKWNSAAGVFENVYGSSKYHYFYDKPTYINDKAKLQGSFVFPNPADKYLTIQMENTSSKPFSMTIYDAAGKVVRYWHEPAQAHFKETIDISDLPNGQYILRTSSEKQWTSRFTVSH